jgi:hypothetical protein
MARTPSALHLARSIARGYFFQLSFPSSPAAFASSIENEKTVGARARSSGRRSW